jgi:hypothetical protein
MPVGPLFRFAVSPLVSTEFPTPVRPGRFDLRPASASGYEGHAAEVMAIRPRRGLLLSDADLPQGHAIHARRS